MAYDINKLDRLTQKFNRKGTSLFIETYDGVNLLNSTELYNITKNPIPDELSSVGRQIINNLVLSGDITGMFKFSAGLARVSSGVGPARVGVFGDSTVVNYGIGSDSQRLGFTSALARLMGWSCDNSVFGNQTGSAGSASLADPRLTFGSGWSNGTDNSFCGGWFTAAFGATGAFSIDTRKGFDRVRVYYLTVGSGTTSTTVKVDGIAIGTFNSNAASNMTYADYTCQWTAKGVISFDTLVGAGGSTYIIGVEWWDSRNPPVIVNQFGSSGEKSTNITNPSNPWSGLSAMAQFQCDLAIVDYWINDSKDSTKTDPAVYLASQQAIYDSLALYGDVIMCGYQPISDLSTTNGYADTMFEQVKTVASGSKLGFAIDWRNALGGTYFEANTNGYMSDVLHNSRAGYVRKATYLAGLL